jgi:hypothetical protein
LSDSELEAIIDDDVPLSSSNPKKRSQDALMMRVPKKPKTPKKPRPQFKMAVNPSQFVSADRASKSGSPSPPPEVELDDDRCPMCGADVEISGLLLFKQNCRGDQPTVREQQAFCATHKQREAEVLWAQRGYPVIDWDHLHNRIAKFQSNIKRLLAKPQESYFRREMEKRERQGNSRTVLQHIDNEGFEGIALGYYGTRGLDIMLVVKPLMVLILRPILTPTEWTTS